MNPALRVGRALRRPPPKRYGRMFPRTRSVDGEVVRMAGALRRARPTLRFMRRGRNGVGVVGESQKMT